MTEPPSGGVGDPSSPDRASNVPYSPQDVGSTVDRGIASQAALSPVTAADPSLSRASSTASSLHQKTQRDSQNIRQSSILNASQANKSYRSSVASETSALGRASSSATTRSSNRLSSATSASAVSRTPSLNTAQPRMALRPASKHAAGDSSPSRSMSTVSEADSRTQAGSSTADGLPLSVPSKTDSLFSGFPYRQALFDLGVPPKQWEEFNDEIQGALNPSTLDRVSQKFNKAPSIPLGLFYLSRYALNAASKRKMNKKMIKTLSEDVGGERIDGLAATLDRWNADVFNAIGLEVTLQLSSAAMSLAKKEERKRKEKERKVREKYGTAGFYEDEDSRSSNAQDADKHYSLLVQRYDGPDVLPRYAEQDPQGVAELPATSEEPEPALLDSTPAHPNAVEMEGSTQVAELPADLDALELKSEGDQLKAPAEPPTETSDVKGGPDNEATSPRAEINPVMHTEGGFLPVELPG